MINGFSEETEPLNEFEKETLLPLLIKGLSARLGSENAVTNKEMIDGLAKMNHKVTAARIRKIINYIRIKKLIVNLVSNSKGYYRTNDLEEVKKYRESLMQRASAIAEVAKSFDV